MTFTSSNNPTLSQGGWVDGWLHPGLALTIRKALHLAVKLLLSAAISGTVTHVHLGGTPDLAPMGLSCSTHTRKGDPALVWRLRFLLLLCATGRFPHTGCCVPRFLHTLSSAQLGSTHKLEEYSSWAGSSVFMHPSPLPTYKKLKTSSDSFRLTTPGLPLKHMRCWILHTTTCTPFWLNHATDSQHTHTHLIKHSGYALFKVFAQSNHS